MRFARRVEQLPVLGLGVSTEYGAGGTPGVLDPSQLRAQHPGFGGFLEVGVELCKGLDADARAWAAAGWPTTYHFLDINLSEPADLTPDWLAGVMALVEVLQPAWLCGDAGLWHMGPRDRAHMLLLPPILSDDSARAMAAGVLALREATGLEVLPENPPGALFLGDLHLLDYFSRVAERADSGLLLDCAHLAMYQRLMGHAPLDGLAGFALDRVVEIHVAGGAERDHQGFAWVEDDHGPEILRDTWSILEFVAQRTPNLKAVVVECERNPLAECLPLFEQVGALLAGSRVGAQP